MTDHVVDVEGEHPQADAELRRGQAGAALVLHGLGEVLDELAQFLVEVDDGIGRRAQHRIAEQTDGLDGHAVLLLTGNQLVAIQSTEGYDRTGAARPGRDLHVTDDHHSPGPLSVPLMRFSRTAGAGLLVVTLGLVATPSAAHSSAPPTLTGFASLPALTFVPGSEPSGAALGTTPVNGIAAPWDDQPVQGFSGVLPNGDGTYDVLSDNGYGNKANSADFLLRIQKIGPVTATGKVDVLGGINLTDPAALVPFPLTRADRVLTGADFDVESIVRAQDGTLWIGDEFGPWLLHFDRGGKLLAAPIPLPGVRAPENPAGKPEPAGQQGLRGHGPLPRRQAPVPVAGGNRGRGHGRRPALQRVRHPQRGVHRKAVDLPPGSPGQRHRRRDPGRREPVPGDRTRQQPGRRGGAEARLPGGPPGP